MPDHCCSAAFCLTEITVPSQPPDSAFSGSLRRSYPHAQYSFSSPQPFSQHPFVPPSSPNARFHRFSHSIPSCSFITIPFPTYFPHPLPIALLSQPSPPSDPVPSSPPLTLPRPLFQVLPPQDATIDHCPNSIPPFQDAPKCLQRDGPSPYASQKRA
ncbi:hypothetical protein PAPYR_7122 [Paratrimastix pyriformis]|uniref:Uncharacterized protein n=1 Tax=Paratrimastix pyriformis TaxID=342808 RepID=A0ABQ8UG73_9EUKA|nr:hypothetical protein PAPYR_7122 [Paratrimastix pyriformis]